MIQINLLPKEKKKAAIEINRGLVFGTLGVIILIFSLAAVTQWQHMKLSDLNESVDEANQELTRLQPILNVVDQITILRNSILSRKQVIEKLDNERGMEVHLFQDLSERLPDYVWLISATQSYENQNLRMDITGYGFSLKHIETFLVKLFKSPMFSSVNLATISQDNTEGGKAYRFVLNTVISPNWLNSEEQGKAKPDSAAAAAPAAQGGLVGKGREALQMDKETGKKAMQGLKP